MFMTVSLIWTLGVLAGEGNEAWHCENALEVHCDEQECSVSDDFTPTRVTLTDRGELTLCAYSGCWSGAATRAIDDRYVVALAGGLMRSSPAEDATDRTPASLTIDRESGMGTMLGMGFAQPVNCIYRK